MDALELEEEVESFIGETTKQAILHSEQKSLDEYCQKQVKSFLLQSHGVHQVRMAKEATSLTRDNFFLVAQILINRQ